MLSFDLSDDVLFITLWFQSTDALHFAGEVFQIFFSTLHAAKHGKPKSVLSSKTRLCDTFQVKDQIRI